MKHPWRIAGALFVAAAAGTAAAASDPAVLYHNYCSVCHGDKGDGKSRAAGSLSTMPRDLTAPQARQEMTKERVALAIAHGRPGTAMVGWKTQLSQADIDALADYIVTRFVMGQGTATSAGISGTRAHGGREADATPKSAATAPAVQADMNAMFAGGLKGDVKRGSAFYVANCATCHGARGDGQGPRAYFINPKPRNFIEDASRARFNRPAIYAAVSEGRLASEMPAWKHVATPQQMADVSEYVLRSFILPKPQTTAQK